MHLKRTIRRGLRRLAQLYADAARANTSYGHAHMTARPCCSLEAAPRANGECSAERKDSGARHR